jgi:LacI family transcriptional regulator
MSQPFKIAVILHPNAPIYRPDDSVFGFDPEDVYFAPLMRGIADRAAEAEVELIYRRMLPEDWAPYTRREGVDGAVLLSFTFTAETAVMSELQNGPVPFVAVGGSPSPDSSFPSVDASNHEAGRRVAEYLIGLGHTRLGCVNLAGDFTNHSDRMQGYREAAAEHGCPIDFSHLLIEYQYERPMFRSYLDLWLSRLLADDAVPTALFACDYWMVDATYAALQKHGIKIPDDVSLIGFDDPPAVQAMKPPLTTVSQPVRDIGRRAVERVIEALCEPEGGRRVRGVEMLPTVLIERESVGLPRDEASTTKWRDALPRDIKR